MATSGYNLSTLNFCSVFYYNHIKKLFIFYETTSTLSPLAFRIHHKLLKSCDLKQNLSNNEIQTEAVLKAQVFWGVTLWLGESFPTFRNIMMSLSSEPNSPKRTEFFIVVTEN
jgi:hypothetical protein